jgi:hypothetical protein
MSDYNTVLIVLGGKILDSPCWENSQILIVITNVQEVQVQDRVCHILIVEDRGRTLFMTTVPKSIHVPPEFFQNQKGM